MRIGALVNPIAGMGGPLALKGTDGEDVLRTVEASGRKRTAPERFLRTARRLASMKVDAEFICPTGQMGATWLQEAGIRCETVCEPKEPTTRTDTLASVRAFLEASVDLILFAGGDGTARDVVEVTGTAVPLVGIPSGVKMHSSVFANSPEEAADLVTSFIRNGSTREAEVMDVDEEAFRHGVVSARVYAMALVPDDSEHLQPGKQSFGSGSATDEAEELAEYLSDIMEPDVLYILGPGTTTAAVARTMGEGKTLLGVDAYRGRRRVGKDMDEKAILSALNDHGRAVVVVTPIGAQGFIFGRGNQQISSRVIRRIGLENIMVVATPTKLRHTAALRVDTGDPELDAEFSGKMKVLVGYRRKRLVTIS